MILKNYVGPFNVSGSNGLDGESFIAGRLKSIICLAMYTIFLKDNQFLQFVAHLLLKLGKLDYCCWNLEGYCVWLIWSLYH